MGSRSSSAFPYIAGFLDGDGSLMLQIKKRKDGALKLRFMSTICFYQDSRHEKPLRWIRDTLGIGYLSRRRDGISELRINGFKQVHTILALLKPFVRFKKVQADVLQKATALLMRTRSSRLSKKQLRRLVKYIVVLQDRNYVTRKKKTEQDLLALFGLTP